MRRMSIVYILVYAILFTLPILADLRSLGVIEGGDIFPWMLRLVPLVFSAMLVEFLLYKLATRILARPEHLPVLTFTLGLILQLACFTVLMTMRSNRIACAILQNIRYLAIAALLVGFFSFFLTAGLQSLVPFSRMRLSRFNPRPRRVVLFAACVCALLILGTTFWPSGGRDRKSSDGNRNVVLITIDSLRFDALGRTGGEIQTPNIDALYDEGIFFNNYCSHAPFTHPALASILTSLEMPFHKVRRQGAQLDDSLVTVSEVLTDNGYACYSPGDLRLYLWGSDQGFGQLGVLSEMSVRWLFGVTTLIAKVCPRYLGEFCFGEDSSMWSTLKALEFLRRNRSRKFFLWIHYFKEPHSPYFAPPSYRTLYNGNKTSWIKGTDQELRALNGYPSFKSALGGHTLTDKDLEYLNNLYRAEVTTCDAEVGMIVGALKEYGLLDDTMIIVTADHGEDFSERGHFGHARNLYGTLLHVPLIVRVPSESTHVTVPDFVMGKDIAPTILGYSGIEVPDQFRGVAILPLEEMPSGDAADRWCYSETPTFGYGWPYDKFGLSYTSGRYKYICVPQEDAEELYDLVADPAETNNIADSEVAVVEAIRSQLLECFGINDLDELIPRAWPQMKKQQRDRLRALGYIE
jgi:arylsulfatase A-like enzyme